MKHHQKIKLTGRKKRAGRVRKKVTGSTERPRLSVHRSLKNVYAQLIDDDKGISILGISSSASAVREQKIEGGKIEVAKAVGKLVAEKAKEKGIKEVVFDRNGFKYHGRVKAIAEGAREAGLKF